MRLSKLEFNTICNQSYLLAEDNALKSSGLWWLFWKAISEVTDELKFVAV